MPRVLFEKRQKKIIFVLAVMQNTFFAAEQVFIHVHQIILLWQSCLKKNKGGNAKGNFLQTTKVF
jgi:hypothetical protein